MWISLSAKRKRSPSEFDWYKFGGERTVRFLKHHRLYDLELEKGAVFGVTPGLRKTFIVVDKDEPAIEFRLSAKEIQLLLKKSVGWSGKVKGVKVEKGHLGKDGKAIPKGGGAPSVGVAPSNKREDRELTRKLQGLKFNPGMKRLTFLDVQDAIPGETYHYYDAISPLRSYRRKHKLRIGEYGNFYRDLEDYIENNMRDVDAEVATVRFKGELKTVVAILRIE